MPYKILIVDDEEPARQLLEKYVEKIDDIEVVGVLSHPLEAKKVMNTIVIHQTFPCLLIILLICSIHTSISP